MPRDLALPIETAAALISGPNQRFQLEIWPQLDIFGSNIPDEIRKKICDTDVLVCDITRQNNNVYYEIGFAIGIGKAVAPVVNISFANAISIYERMVCLIIFLTIPTRTLSSYMTYSRFYLQLI